MTNPTQAVHMQFPTKTWALAAIAALLCSCGPGAAAVEISIVDHADALTAGGKDNLFTLTVSKASQSWAVADLSIFGNLAGETATQFNFQHADLNGDGKLDQGESLTCTEPGVSLYDATGVGKVVSVSIAERRAGTSTRVTFAQAQWTPAN